PARAHQWVHLLPAPAGAPGTMRHNESSHRSPFLFSRDSSRGPVSPSGTNEIDHDHHKSRTQHLPARPYTGVEIERRVKHAQRRDMKRDADANRLTYERDNRHPKAEREQR